MTNKLSLKFDGDKLDEGVIGIYDLASTIMALGNTIDSISSLQGYTKGQKLKIDVSALRPGSFEVDIIVNFEIVKEVALATSVLICSSEGINCAKNVLEILRTIIDVKKFLKGEKPKDVKIDQSGKNAQAIVYNINGDNMTINMPVYNAMQDKGINKHVHDIFGPLSKEESNIDSINIKIDNEQIGEKPKDTIVTKEEVDYFENIGELQNLKDYKIKAIVSRLDSKTGNGFLSMGSKRISFEMNGIDFDKYDESFIVLAESLKLKFPIYVTGEATLDYESNLKKIKISKVESDAKLF